MEVSILPYALERRGMGESENVACCVGVDVDVGVVGHVCFTYLLLMHVLERRGDVEAGLLRGTGVPRLVGEEVGKREFVALLGYACGLWLLVHACSSRD